MPLYPHLHLLPDGSVFYTGSYNTHYPTAFRLKGFPASRLVEEPSGGAWNDHKARETESGEPLVMCGLRASARRAGIT